MQRENTSTTKATYTKPTQVATYVMSATQSWFGRVAVNSRSTRSGGRIAASSVTVVSFHARPRTAPRSPISRISRSTVQRATAMSSRTSCRQTFSAP